MSRRAVDPVDRAFNDWRLLTIEQQKRLADRQYGWQAAQWKVGEPTEARVRQRKPKPPAAGE